MKKAEPKDIADMDWLKKLVQELVDGVGSSINEIADKLENIEHHLKNISHTLSEMELRR